MIQTQPRICAYCGNNPVPHFVYWFNDSLNIFTGPLRRFLLYNRVISGFKSRGFSQRLGRIFFWLCLRLNILTLQKDPAKCRVRRAQVLWEEAEKRNIEMQELLFFGRPFDCYVVSKETRNKKQETSGTRTQMFFSGLPRPAGYDNRILDAMDDKWLFKKIMMKHALPVAKGGSAGSFREAKKIFAEIQKLKQGKKQETSNKNQELGKSQISKLKPVIVKPRTGSRGRHSTTFVLTQADLKRAFKIAKQLCHWAVVEEHLFGPVYRATVVDFKLRGVLRGDGPFVTGDGVLSISELIKVKNAKRHARVKEIAATDEMALFVCRELAYQNPEYRMKNRESFLDYVPGLGETVSLSEKVGLNYGGSSSEDISICHPDNKLLFIRAARALGDPIVGFDFIIPDISKPWQEQNCGFIEVNSLPFINLHHDPLLGQPQNVAAAVWDMMGM